MVIIIKVDHKTSIVFLKHFKFSQRTEFIINVKLIAVYLDVYQR